MKLGILSMNYAKNYGGIMQTYGLYRYLRSLGHDVYVINYKNSGKKTLLNYCTKICKKLKSNWKRKGNMARNPEPLSKRYLENFIEFRTKIQYTELVNEYTISEICSQMDVVIIGSDQIWNDINSNKLVYYFDWKYNGKKIAYAACTVLEESPFIIRPKIKKLLDSFDFISVRDKNTQQFVVSNGISQPPIVVDPTLLYDYNDIIDEPLIEGQYILTYILSGEIAGGLKNAISCIKRNIGEMKVVSVCIPCESTIAKDSSDLFLTEAAPSQWINLFRHASFVLTDSFHGIMFSLKFHKPFIAYYLDKNRSSRLVDLSETYGLYNIIDNVSDISHVFSNGVINYDNILPKIEQNVFKSKSLIEYEINN